MAAAPNTPISIHTYLPPLTPSPTPSYSHSQKKKSQSR